MRGSFLILLSLFFSLRLFALDPKYLQIKIYALYISESEYCTQPVELFVDNNPESMSVLGSPNFGERDNGDGELDGTYRCLIIKIADTLSFSPDSTNIHCEEGEDYTYDTCGLGTTTTDIEGVSSTCTASEDVIFLYLSTASTTSGEDFGGSGGGNPFVPPSASDTSNGFTLDSPWIISGAETGTLVVNGTDKVRSFGGSCELQPPSFSFR